LALKIQVTSVSKIRWTDGVLAVIATGSELLGGADLLEGAPEAGATRRQFEVSPASEASVILESGKQLRAATFLSTDQVKYLEPADKLRVLGSRAFKAAGKWKASKLIMPLENASDEQIAALVQGAQVAAYRFDKYKSSVEKTADQTLTLAVGADSVKRVQKLVAREEELTASVNFARDIVNEPPAELYPEELARRAKKAADAVKLKITVYDEKRLAKDNFNGLLTVGRGSHHTPRLMVFEHNGGGKKPAVHLCLVGKAITFDTGGHSLKQAKGMWEMKGDMAGGAAVIGAMLAIARLNPNVKVTGIVPSAVNAIGPDAVLPGDIIRSRSGKTVHVDNTDAEGRLILMDALDLARELGATHIIDAATLTGSIVRALGEAIAGMFANADDWAAAIKAASEGTGEHFWQMPLIREYREQLDHPVADMDNVGKSINAGAIVAALFLQEFVPDTIKWAHLDIAAVGLYTRAYRHWGPGGSGFGVRTLARVAESLGQK